MKVGTCLFGKTDGLIGSGDTCLSAADHRMILHRHVIDRLALLCLKLCKDALAVGTDDVLTFAVDGNGALCARKQLAKQGGIVHEHTAGRRAKEHLVAADVGRVETECLVDIGRGDAIEHTVVDQ